jgi:hypothetical protein
MAATIPFDRWIASGCPDEFDYDGMAVDADWVLSVEYEAIHESGPIRLDDAECDRLGLPHGSTNAEAVEHLRKRWPIDLPPRPDRP